MSVLFVVMGCPFAVSSLSYLLLIPLFICPVCGCVVDGPLCSCPVCGCVVDGPLCRCRVCGCVVEGSLQCEGFVPVMFVAVDIAVRARGVAGLQ